MKDKVEISKQFSWILRHGAHEIPSVSMDEEGFVTLSDLLEIPSFSRSGVDVNFVKEQ